MKRINRINNSGYLYSNDSNEAQNAEVTSGINRGPMALLSLGTFLIVIWLVILLPGQDIAAGQPRSQYQESQEQAAAETSEPLLLPPHLDASTPVMILPARHPHFYHWRLDCPLVHDRNGTMRRPGATPLYAQVRQQHLRPCHYCLALAAGDRTIFDTP